MNALHMKGMTKKIARLLLCIWILNLVQPLGAYALTSGPAQPEAQSFQPVGVSDMVDLFSGDFKYNIPLMDVDGYPLNLNYGSGIGIDDEASWVGLGWNLNVGAINRQLRGIPDDFAGDEMQTDHYTKPKITVGGRLTAKVEIRGKYIDGASGKKEGAGARFNGSLTFGVFSDNYTGIGAEIGANAGLSFSLANDGMLTAGLGIGVLSSTAGGVDVTPNVSMSVMENSKTKGTVNAGLSSSLGYNSRSGMKTLSFGKSFSGYSTSSPAMSFNTEPIMPKVQVPYDSKYGSFSIDAGGTIFGIYGGIGGTGYKSVRSVKSEHMSNPAYGFLYAEQGKNKTNALMDFIREKENPVIPELPNLALPVHTPDIFTYNSQNGSGQFRLFRGGTGAFFDNQATDQSKVSSEGGDIGFGAIFHGGITHFDQTTKNTTRKWTSNNNYLKNGDFQDEPTTDPRKQHVFFRKTDEKNIEDQQVSGKINENALLSISTSGKTANSSFVSKTSIGSNVNVYAPIQKEERQVQSTSISYLTANEAADAGLDKNINTYSFNDYGSFQPPAENTVLIPVSESRRNNPVKKKHHISEITVNSPDGQRTVYGMPVYNLSHEEYSFALGSNYDSKDGLAAIDNGIVRNKGIDHYYHKDSQAPYAYTYLISGLLSPDYVDKTGNGITEDDNGTGIKFNYSKIDNYQWRTPYEGKFNGVSRRTASVNRGLLADADDDKGSIVYGKKEICYVHSIESKTKIAYFITADREDGLGVIGINGDPDVSVRQKCLKEIRLYSKFNLSKPIKVVKFEYGYDLCPGTPNSIATGGGKLTLKKVWFEYGLTHKGANHPYTFNYNMDQPNSNVAYGSLLTDRWGTYKSPASNPGTLSNEEYPYSNQVKTSADEVAGMWHMKSIELPSGGKIMVDYESDDYAYVQNKPAMEMVPFEMIGTPNRLAGASGISIAITETPNPSLSVTDWFKRTYLNGADYIYTKSYVKLSTENAASGGKDYDFVPVYCKIKSVTVENGRANINFEPVNEASVAVNPIRSAAWQRLKNEYPKYAYPGFQNKVGDNSSGSVGSAVNAIINAAKNLSELKENFYQKANRKQYADLINTSKSFARIAKVSGFKLGGGIRVRKISISDNWDELSGTEVQKGIYGQSYDYTTISNGRKISSGVAAYEPSIGNDENPLKQPVPYIQKIKGAINNYFELEAPFGESFFPGPSVGYSKVTVRDLGAGALETLSPKTGSIVNEFYTAKDFPVRVQVSDMQRYNPKPSSQYSLIKTQSIEEMVLSQGYSIELNDMHGKSKSNRIFNQGGSEISSTVYSYQVENAGNESLQLNNTVPVVDSKGFLTPKVIGRDIEFFTDFREQETTNTGTTINLGVDVIPFIWGALPLPHWPINGNNEYKLFRSACAVKVTSTSGIVNKVVKTENGSSIAVENVAYDGISGEALITKTQNEFKKDYYSINLPAYWMYPKMGGAYQNLGMILKNISLNNLYEVNESYRTLLTQGDELVNLASGNHYWVVNNRSSVVTGTTLAEPTKMLIDTAGRRLETLATGNLFKVVRSGFRNQQSSSAGSMVSVENPIQQGRLQLVFNQDLAKLKVISASATAFDDEWPVDGKGQAPPSAANSSKVFTYERSGPHEAHGVDGSRYYNPGSGSYSGSPYYTFTNPYLNKRLDNIGIWPDTLIANSVNEPLGILTSFNAPESKTYYIGFGGDDSVKVNIDNGAFILANNLNTYNFWEIRAVYLTAGLHTIEVEGFNNSIAPNTLAVNPGAIGVEIYNNSISQIVGATGPSSLNPIFQTTSVIGDPNVQTFRTQDGVRIWRFSYGNIYNPFIQGIKGNWRPYQQMVYQENRVYNQIFTPEKRGVDVKNSGYLKTFFPFWSNVLDGLWTANSNENSKWVISNTVSLYDQYGQELENKDALNRYSAAKFDFRGQLPSAVASNAMNREVYANAFEDLVFNQSVPDTSTSKEFIQANGSAIYGIRSIEDAHTGHYSLILPQDGIVLSTIQHLKEQKTFPYLVRNVRQEFNLVGTPGLFPRGFEPVPGKKYIFNAWVKDGHADDRNLRVALYRKSEATGYLEVALSCKAIVEGWKLVEGIIDLSQVPGGQLQLKLAPVGSVNLYLDDVRIHPYDAHLKSYAYDDKNFKLMAELDENAFATFYEYDDEGSLVRVKKETERGIVTLKENRSSYRKHTAALPD